jgi:hypothetical protein
MSHGERFTTFGSVTFDLIPNILHLKLLCLFGKVVSAGIGLSCHHGPFDAETDAANVGLHHSKSFSSSQVKSPLSYKAVIL